MRNIKLTLEYDGSDFVGWQVQPNGRSVQEELEKALRQILQADCTTHAAGRTDSGVHARGQVANFLTPASVPVLQLQKSLNGVLPGDVKVLQAEEVDEQFHARYSATARQYQYHIIRRPSAVLRKYSWEVGYLLDVPLLQRSAEGIIGEHDFESYCKAESEIEHHRCIVRTAEWKESDSSLLFEITANRFLHGMVRALVGTMIDVGRGYTSLEQFHAILDKKDRRAAGMAAPARGLFLEKVFY